MNTPLTLRDATTLYDAGGKKIGRLTDSGLDNFAEDDERHARELLEAVNVRGKLLDLLALACEAVESFIDDDPERAGSSFVDTGCPTCTQGCVPNRLNTGLCWLHQAQRILKENDNA